MLNLALFISTFLPLVALTAVPWRAMRHKPMDVAVPRPKSNDYYLAIDGTVSLDHRVLFHGEKDTPKSLKAAEVLLLGNSRLMFGFPCDPFRKLFRRFGMSYYMLGFGHSERDLFPLALIRKFDLRPKLVIVNADNFFIGHLCPIGEKVIHESRFEGCKQIFEGESTYRVRSYLHRYLPHWLYLYEGRGELVVHRSRRDGTWHAPSLPASAIPVPDLPGKHAPLLEPQHLVLARQFHAEIERRGARLILTYVPSEYGRLQDAERIACHLNVPLISPRLQGLETFDTSHLTPQSARRFTTAFLTDLEGVLQPALSSPPSMLPPTGPSAITEPGIVRSDRETTVR